MIPGANLLNAAFMMVSPQPFEYSQFLGRVVNSIGLYESAYGPRVQLLGSIQAVPRNVYQEYGLDLQKNYVTIFVSREVVDLTRKTSGDEAFINGLTLQIISQTNWYHIDGWVSFLAVEVDNEN